MDYEKIITLTFILVNFISYTYYDGFRTIIGIGAGGDGDLKKF